MGAAALAELRELPQARMLQDSRNLWMRESGEWLYVPDIYAMQPSELAMFERLHEARNAAKTW